MRTGRRMVAAGVGVLLVLGLSGRPAIARSDDTPPWVTAAAGPVQAGDASTSAVLRRRAVWVDLDGLAALRVGDRAGIQLVEGTAVVRVDRTQRTTGGGLALGGTIADAPGSAVSMLVRAGSVRGLVRLPGHGTFRVSTRADGTHAVEEIDEAQLGVCAVADGGPIALGPPPAAGGAEPPADGCGDGSEIDVLVLYTPAARAAAGGTAAIEAEIELAVVMSNDAYAASDIDVTLELVHVAETAYGEGGSYTDHLNRLTHGADGIMDEAHTLRDAYGADLVSLVVADPAYCGLAWLLSNPSGPWSDGFGFSVVTWTCAAGNLSFAHELGHNIGCCHDPANCAGGYFADSYGHRFTGNSGFEWRTVMAYAPGIRVGQFSNPAVNYDGQPTGLVGTRDNARTISTNVAVVANFRCDVDPPEDDDGVLAPDGGGAGDQFGSAVANAGDLDDDGVDDVVVGAPFNDEGGDKAGKIYAFSGVDGALLFSKRGKAADERFGLAVAGAGDVNDDGYDDVAVGAPYADAEAGYVAVYSGRDGSRLHKFRGDRGDRFGFAISGAVDVNDDGHDDVIVGAPYNGDRGKKAGQVLVYSGRNGARLHRLYGEAAGDRFGYAVAGAGRIDSGRYEDFVVGAPYNDDGGKKAGKAYVYSGEDGDRLHTLTGQDAGDRFGSAVAGVGRVDGDGRGDFAVGSPYADRGSRRRAGRVDVFSGRDGARLWTRRGSGANDRLGSAVAAAGDADADGRDDVLMGAPRHDGTGSDAGRAEIRSGADGGLITRFDGAAAGDRFGSAVAGALDTGDADVLIGAPRYDDDGSNDGRAYLFDSAVGGTAGDGALDGPTAGDPADVDGSGIVDAGDVTRLLAAWGRCGACAEDVNGDERVDHRDLRIVLDRMTE